QRQRPRPTNLTWQNPAKATHPTKSPDPRTAAAPLAARRTIKNTLKEQSPQKRAWSRCVYRMDTNNRPTASTKLINKANSRLSLAILRASSSFLGKTMAIGQATAASGVTIASVAVTVPSRPKDSALYRSRDDGRQRNGHGCACCG